jgi:hypothetical protein
MKPTTVHARLKTLGLNSWGARPTRRSGRLLLAFKEPDPHQKIQIVDLTCDDGQPATATATAPAVVILEPAKASWVVIREPARALGVVIWELARSSTRVLVPIVEKGL